MGRNQRERKGGRAEERKTEQIAAARDPSASFQPAISRLPRGSQDPVLTHERARAVRSRPPSRAITPPATPPAFRNPQWVEPSPARSLFVCRSLHPVFGVVPPASASAIGLPSCHHPAAGRTPCYLHRRPSTGAWASGGVPLAGRRSHASEETPRVDRATAQRRSVQALLSLKYARLHYGPRRRRWASV